LSDLLDTEQGFLKEYSLSMIVYNAACFWLALANKNYFIKKKCGIPDYKIPKLVHTIYIHWKYVHIN
jgi:hypothetical protein